MGIYDNNPCKGCNRRYPGCHSDCEDGIEWRRKFDEHKKRYIDEQNRNLAINDVLADGRRRRQRRIHIKEKER